MLGARLHKANTIAKRRFKKWYPDWDAHFYEKHFGMLRKTNVMCSCHMCRNPRHSNFTKKSERPTIQERKAATVEEFNY